MEILRAVLEVALEDDQVSSEELSLIRRLREKLEIHEKTKRIVLAELGYFPRKENHLHEPSDFRDVLIDLQKRGVVFYCNRLDGGRYVLPEELVDGVKAALGIEMTRVGWKKLLEHLTKEQLATILESAGLPKSGNKPELQERIRLAGLAPTESLGASYSLAVRRRLRVGCACYAARGVAGAGGSARFAPSNDLAVCRRGSCGAWSRWSAATPRRAV